VARPGARDVGRRDVARGRAAHPSRVAHLVRPAARRGPARCSRRRVPRRGARDAASGATSPGGAVEAVAPRTMGPAVRES
jgi:hypothetical protein